MNKIVIVLVAAVASCVCASTFTPKRLPCAFSAEMNTTTSGITVPGHMWGMQKGDEFYSRMEMTMGGQVITTGIVRCDKKDSKGNCFSHELSMGVCNEDYVDGANEYNTPFVYDSKKTVSCPVGDGDCTKYCYTPEKICIFANKDDLIVGAETSDEDVQIVVTLKWLDEEFTTEKFAVETCDGKKMSAPESPCDDSSSSAPSLVMVSFIALVAALLALF